MKTLTQIAIAAALLAAPFVASEASAHARLIKAMPADGATTSSPQMIMLTFNEKVEGKLSGFEIVKADGTKVDVMASVPAAAPCCTPCRPSPSRRAPTRSTGMP